MQEGMIALWRGWLPSVIGVIPYVGLNFSVYETLKDMTLKAYGKNAFIRIASRPSVVTFCLLSIQHCKCQKVFAHIESKKVATLSVITRASRPRSTLSLHMPNAGRIFCALHAVNVLMCILLNNMRGNSCL